MISIIIAVGPGRNVEVLESLKGVDYKNYEVIIEEGLNPSENRNRGVKKAKYNILAFIDDDAYLKKDILKNVEEFFNKYKEIDAVGGPQLTPKADNFFAKCSGYVLSSLFGGFSMRKRYKKSELNLNANETDITSANFFIRKDVFLKVGGFNPKLYPGEDPEFFNRIKLGKFKLAYNPDLVVYHRRRDNLKGLIIQIYKYGYVRLFIERNTGWDLKPFFIMPSLFLIYLISLPFWLIIHEAFWIPLFLYLFFNLVSSLWIAVRKNIISLPLVFFLYFVIHLSYGAGMIVGVTDILRK